jgi:hypothetical protein
MTRPTPSASWSFTDIAVPGGTTGPETHDHPGHPAHQPNPALAETGLIDISLDACPPFVPTVPRDDGLADPAELWATVVEYDD